MRVPRDRPLDVAERRLVGRFVLDVEVTERRLADSGLDPGDQVLRIDRRVHAVFPKHGDGDDVHLLRLHHVSVAAFLDLFPSPEGDGIRAGQTGRLQKPRRVQPQVQLVQFRQFWRDSHRLAVAVDVPRRTAVDNMSLPRRPLCGSAPLPAQAVPPRRRIQPGFSIEGLRARASLPVDSARVIGQRIDARPIHVDRVLERLANGAAVALPP